MVEIAIKLLALVAGIWAAFASYPYLNLHVVALLAFVAAIAVGILTGVAVLYVLSWIFGKITNTPR